MKINEMKNEKQWHFKKLAEVVRNKRLTPLQKILLVDILLYAGVSGDAFPSQQTLAENQGYTTRSIRYALDMLYAAGLLKRKRRGFAKSNIYIINEELYFRNDTSNDVNISSEEGNNIPNYSSTSLPPNVTQLNNSNNDLSEAEKEQIERRKQEIREKYPFLKGGSRK
ncbi:hypothetical protein A3A56_03885 [Candidatus Roizmanbacteria bacterium RIFCSPLOWO2_01_FULL_40_32]|nr:MAG: hypothetical protein A3A56_03885 [Candidatus Roizmanbacteria bacterium RIFCSPLOWO2_01_FULL_40_32]